MFNGRGRLEKNSANPRGDRRFSASAWRFLRDNQSQQSAFANDRSDEQAFDGRPHPPVNFNGAEYGWVQIGSLAGRCKSCRRAKRLFWRLVHSRPFLIPASLSKL